MNQEKEKKKKFSAAETLYHIYIGAFLLVINLYFFIFVHYRYDLSPNFALAVLTVPAGIYELYKAIKYS